MFPLYSKIKIKTQTSHMDMRNHHYTAKNVIKSPNFIIQSSKSTLSQSWNKMFLQREHPRKCTQSTQFHNNTIMDVSNTTHP